MRGASWGRPAANAIDASAANASHAPLHCLHARNPSRAYSRDSAVLLLFTIRMRYLVLEIRKHMTDTTQQSAAGGIVQSYIHTTEIVERPAADRPLRDTVDAIADWLLGPALQLATGAQAVDEFAWRMLAAGFPLARLTVHSGMLHPQFLGTSLIWWRDTGQTVQTFIEHEVLDVVAYHDNPVLRVIQGGETLRRRIDVADSELDLPILHDLKAKGCTDYLALPISGAHGRRYAVTYTTDCVDGLSTRQVAELTHISQRM